MAGLWWAPPLLLITMQLMVSEASPKFAAAIGTQNVVAGRSVSLTCVVQDLGPYQVAWVHLERQMILSIHDKVITSISRFRLVPEDPQTWVLHISDVQSSDGGYYMCQVNTVPLMSQVGFLNVLEPPHIVDENSTKSTVSVRTRENVTLTCAARGVPTPTIKWVREDGGHIRVRPPHGERGRQRHAVTRRQHGSGKGDPHWPTVIEGNTLNLTHVTRSDMGPYLCIARNGVPPTVSKRIHLFVQFKPMIWVSNQLMGGAVGGSVTLRCRSEAHPRPIFYWMKNNTEQHGLIIKSRKYHIRTISMKYSTEMVLQIRHLNASDFGKYLCVCKNPIGEVTGVITLYEMVEPTTAGTTTTGYPRWPAATELVTFRNGGGEHGGDTGDIYIPAEEGDPEKKRSRVGGRHDRERSEQRRPDHSTARPSCGHGVLPIALPFQPSVTVQDACVGGLLQTTVDMRELSHWSIPLPPEVTKSPISGT
ncbi:protein amalgam-like [Pollicipes pollicipes]|uniref:protein amalgam-like n=1 Tax=Pollicipes pollicipes TaxID=41117 RepID=UPI0018850A38|nr:protein amalgam-like [Pollicipes pollicipes]